MPWEFAWIDWVFIALIAYNALVGLFRGLVQELFKLGAIIAGWLAAGAYCNKAGAALFSDFKSKVLADSLAYLLVFIAVYIAVRITGFIAKKLLRLAVTAYVDRAAGLVFGSLKGFVFAIVLFLIIVNQSFFKVNNLLKRSLFCPLALEVSLSVRDRLPSSAAGGLGRAKAVIYDDYKAGKQKPYFKRNHRPR